MLVKSVEEAVAAQAPPWLARRKPLSCVQPLVTFAEEMVQQRVGCQSEQRVFSPSANEAHPVGLQPGWEQLELLARPRYKTGLQTRNTEAKLPAHMLADTSMPCWPALTSLALLF